MADLTLANSGYSSGAIDTASTLVNNVSATDAQHINGPNSGVVQMEGILGVGTDLKGTAADLVARLAVEHNADGTQKTLTVAKGGTGDTSVSLGALLLGNLTSNLFVSAGIAEQVPFFQGSATASWTSGLAYQGPAQTGPSSTVAHGGTTTISVNQNLTGVNFYTNLTVNASVTVTVTANTGAVIIYAANTITINGTLTGVGGGSAGGVGAAGDNGTEQAGGGGGGGSAASGFAGGAALIHGITVQAGGAGGGAGLGGVAPAARSGATALRSLLNLSLLGGAGGGAGGGGGGNGGAGGGSIVLIAPTIVLGASSTLRTDGTAGSNGGVNTGGGGGGGAGSLYLICRTLTDNGATISTSGGAAGSGAGGGAAGAAGANAIQQKLYYGV